ARSLAAQEQTQAKQMWPRMNVAGVAVTDGATTRYNCLAWALGITTSWIWPWTTATVTKTQFDAFYLGEGYIPAASGSIAVFGLNAGAMTHGSISGPGHGPRWESTCGAWLRIQHGLAEMEGGSLYGTVVGFYTRPAPGVAQSPTTMATRRIMKLEKLSKADVHFLQDRARQVNPEMRARFQKSYEKWKK